MVAGGMKDILPKSKNSSISTRLRLGLLERSRRLAK
jgi:hypothetical protein